jgi:UDP-N-acetylglucosamine diphosphorylase/glucosamine-1-phosphate N-acetyltransferase
MKPGGLVLFEDAHWADLAPLTDLLPVPALVFGASDLATRWQRAVDAPLLSIEARAGVMRAWRTAPTPAASRPDGAEEVLVANAAALPGPWLAVAERVESPVLFTVGDRLVGARLSAAMVAQALGRGGRFEDRLSQLDLPRLAVDARLIAWPWQMVEWNAEAIAADLAQVRGAVRGAVHKLAAVEEPERVTVETGARVDAYAVLDARQGPIHIGADAVVLSHTLVVGPCAVGAATHLIGGSIGRSTIGPGCRIGGEVDETVWQGWANKRHHGFVGHSLIGEWANLGALTTTSDLKNNYGTIRVQAGGREVDSGLIKLGSIIGSAVKTGIGTLLPTGAVVGTGSHLFGGGRYAPKDLPAFSWWDGERLNEYKLEKFLATARVAMSRRGREITAQEEAALRSLFAETNGARRAAKADRRVYPRGGSSAGIRLRKRSARP